MWWERGSSGHLASKTTTASPLDVMRLVASLPPWQFVYSLGRVGAQAARTLTARTLTARTRTARAQAMPAALM